MATIAIRVPSSTQGKFYEVRLGADANWYCTCPAWKYQRGPVAQRACKHMRALAGSLVKA